MAKIIRAFLVVDKENVLPEKIVDGFITLKDLENKGLLKGKLVYEIIYKSKKELFGK